MLQLINNLPPRVVGVHAYADVTLAEYVEALTPLFETAVRRNRKINFVLVLETDIADFEPGNWCGSTTLGLKYFFKWNKVAIVTDQPQVTGYSDLFKWIIPGKFKNFGLIDLPAAIRWVSYCK